MIKKITILKSFDFFDYICIVMMKELSPKMFALILLFSNISFGAPNPPQPAAPPPTGFPIDSAIYLLMFVGILYVLVNFKRRQKNSQFDV